MSMGFWGQRWVESRLSLKNLDPSLLMWDMRRNLNPAPLPGRRVVISFRYTDLPRARRDWWLLVAPQTGCPPGDACDLDDAHLETGGTTCRPIDEDGDDSSRCASERECGAGFTCVEDPAGESAPQPEHREAGCDCGEQDEAGGFGDGCRCR